MLSNYLQTATDGGLIATNSEKESFCIFVLYIRQTRLDTLLQNL